MIIDRRFFWAFVLGCIFCWWINSGRGSSPSPFNPMPQNDRPVLRWVARAAKTALWFMLIAEPAPEQRQVAQHAVGDDGFPVIDHARAF